MLLQSYFPFLVLNRKTILSKKKKKKSNLLRLLLAYAKTFVFNDGQITKVGNNLLEEIDPQWNCIVSKNTCFQQIFMEAKRKVKKCLDS